MPRRLLFLVLLLAFVRGLLYLAVMPPWQHYDEPTHFEYMRLIAERQQLPQPKDYDLEMRREIAASMLAADFWQIPPEIDFSSDTPPKIGISELNHPPLYYAFLAVPQLLLRFQAVETQLYLARLGSVLLYVIVVGSAYGLVREAFPLRRWLPITVAAFITLLPPFTDLMSAVNNDVGAVAAVSLLLWASVHLIRRGLSFKRIVLVLLLAGVCLFTKSTASITAAAILLIVGISLVPESRLRWLAPGLVLLIPLALIAAFTWGGYAASWYNGVPAKAPNRAQVDAPWGDAAFALSAKDAPYTKAIYQELSLNDGKSLAGRTITLGAWFKTAEASGRVVGLTLRDRESHSQTFAVTSDWQFQAFTATVGAQVSGVTVHLSVRDSDTSSQVVYVDGIVLVDGIMPLSKPPQFETARGAGGRWGAQAFTNLVQNGSAERTWLTPRNWLGQRRLYQKPISWLFHSLIDWSRTNWVYQPELLVLLGSFWAAFGWGHVMLPSVYTYILGLVFVAGLAGCAIGLARQLKSTGKTEPWQHRIWILFGVICLVSWGGALLRIHPVSLATYIHWPVARYAAVAMVPTATLLCVGLATVTPKRWLGWAAMAGLMAMITLDTIALLTAILPYYYG